MRSPEQYFRYYGTGALSLSTWRRSLSLLRHRLSWILTTRGYERFKRTVDFLVSLGALLVLSPLFLVIAIAVKLTDGGPILFWQRRVGQFGREFDFPKFRSMVVNAEALKTSLLEKNDHSDGVTFKMKRDPRITAVGRLLRRTSFDELPQLWCVLTGKMALVGPRPPVPREVALYSVADRRRLDVKPGLTCIWQVSGRSELCFKQQVELDIEYIESRSVGQDIKLLAKTVPAVISGRGAY